MNISLQHASGFPILISLVMVYCILPGAHHQLERVYGELRLVVTKSSNYRIQLVFTKNFLPLIFARTPTHSRSHAPTRARTHPLALARTHPRIPFSKQHLPQVTCLFLYVSCVSNAYVCVLSRRVSCVSCVSSSFLLWVPFPRVSPALRLNFPPGGNTNQDNIGFVSCHMALFLLV